MISSHKIRGKKIDKKIEYYISYAARGAETFWLGGAATDLGLNGGVEPEVFLALAEGRAPDGGRLLERIAENRTPGWDFTLSAPKSVSLCWALADDELRAQIAGAHREAVAAAFSYLEREGGRARRGFGGRDGHVQARLAIACFTHPASRELDPQLHTHGIILNVAHGVDNRWTALDSRTVFLHRRAAGAIYRAELRERVAALGGRWSSADRRGLSELEGFEKETLRDFSQRRSAIEAMLDQSGLSGRAASEAACLSTRREKVAVELGELRSTWVARAAAHGWDHNRVGALLDGTDRRAPFDEARQQRQHERLVGPQGLTKHRSAFTRDDAVVAWCEAHTQGTRLENVDRLVDATLSRPEIVPLVVADQEGRPLTTAHGPARGGIVRLVRAPASGVGMLVCEPRYSTTELIWTEERVFSLARRGTDSRRGVVGTETIERVLSTRTYLSEEQASMVRTLCSSGDALSLVVGVPGSGKTFALEVAHASWQAAGYRVIGAALSAEAAAQLEAGSKIPSATLDHLLHGIGLPADLHASVRLDHNSVVVVDEASMVDTRRLARLLEHTTRVGAKIVLCGDDRQLPSIEAGGAFSALARKLGATRLSDNGRQVERWEREALIALRDGRAGEAAGQYRRHGRVHVATDPGALLGQMVESWWAARSSGDDAVLYSYAREAARVLNRLARARAEADGCLSGPEITVSAWAGGDLTERAYRVGDEVTCLRNRARLGQRRDRSGQGVRNGTRGKVTAIEVATGELSITTNDGRQVTLPADYVRGFTDYGYAWTLHKGQGQTVGETRRADDRVRRHGRAFVFGAESLTAEAALVAASRATDSTELFVLVDPDEGAETPTGLPEALGRSWSRSEHQRLATEELDMAAEIARLSLKNRRELADERDELLALIGPGPSADLCSRANDAQHRLGTALVQRGEIIDQERELNRQVSDPETSDRRSAHERLGATRRIRLAVERESLQAHEVARAVERAIVERAGVRARFGSDVRSALDRLEVVDSAFSTKRRREIDELAADPPAYVVGLIGRQPSDQARLHRWRQGLVEIEDWRRAVGLTRTNHEDDDPWQEALGPELEGWEGRRQRKTAGHLRQVRRDLGIKISSEARAQADAATAAVVGRVRGPSGASQPAATRRSGRSVSR